MDYVGSCSHYGTCWCEHFRHTWAALGSGLGLTLGLEMGLGFGKGSVGVMVSVSGLITIE